MPQLSSTQKMNCKNTNKETKENYQRLKEIKMEVIVKN